MNPALIVDVAAIEKRPGTFRAIDGRFTLDGLALSTAAVIDDVVEVALEVEVVIDGIVVTGSVEASWSGPCRRCLDDVDDTVHCEVREVFERNNDEGETYPIDEQGRIDLEPLVREAVLLALPLAPLCRSDCPGPAPDAYPAGVAADPPPDAAGESEEPLRDPRWAALDELR